MSALKLGAIPAAQAEIFAYSVKIVCGKQTETNCCCVAGARPGVYATEVGFAPCQGSDHSELPWSVRDRWSVRD